MTIDHIAVERETDGKLCGKNCQLRIQDHFDDYVCAAFDEIYLRWDRCLDGYRRCPSCIATPPAALLTDQMREAVEQAIELLLSTINDYGDCEHDVGHCVCKYHGVVFNLRAAFGDAALAAAKEE